MFSQGFHSEPWAALVGVQEFAGAQLIHFHLEDWHLEQRQCRLIPGQTAQPFCLVCFPPACCWLSPHPTAGPCSPQAPKAMGSGERGASSRQSCASRAGRARLAEPRAAGAHCLQLLHVSLPCLSRRAAEQREPFPASAPSQQTAAELAACTGCQQRAQQSSTITLT